MVQEYTGTQRDLDEAAATLKRVFEPWGRPVNLKTIAKTVDDRDREVARRRDREPDPVEAGRLLRFDGDDVTIEELDWADVAAVAAAVDYSTKPADWLG